MKRALATFSIVLAAFAACGGRTGLATGQPDTVDASFDSVVLDWCGPVDQSALFFRLEPTATCTLESTIQPSGAGMVFYGMALPNGPGQYPIEDGSPGTTSSGYWCASKGACITATSGTLTLTEMTHDVAVGSWVLTLEGGVTKSGTFTATVCHNAIACG
jgi:hypothetical protein